MDLLEFEAKRRLAQKGVPVPRGSVAFSVEAAIRAGCQLDFPLMVKAQVPSGGRKKAGAVVEVHDVDELNVHAARLLGSCVAGDRTRAVLIEEYLPTQQEIYLAFQLDTGRREVLALLSPYGGIDIEKAPEAPVMHGMNGVDPFMFKDALRMAKEAGFEGNRGHEVAELLVMLAELVWHWDATTLEINPLLHTSDGRLIAADAKIVIDESAAFRHELGQSETTISEDDEDDNEARARRMGLQFVPLSGGTIGIIAGGAGLALATMDTVRALGSRPANFLDVGGGVSREKMAAALELLGSIAEIDGVIINVFGGINNCQVMAEGILAALAKGAISGPLVVKMRGHEQETAWKILEQQSIEVVRWGTTGQAVKKLLKQIEDEANGHMG